jgi:hypothetical protein
MAAVKHGECLVAGHEGNGKTLFAIYLISRVGMGLTLLWKLYIPFALMEGLWFFEGAVARSRVLRRRDTWRRRGGGAGGPVMMGQGSPWVLTISGLEAS